jgi:hypothetical protein
MDIRRFPSRANFLNAKVLGRVLHNNLVRSQRFHELYLNNALKQPETRHLGKMEGHILPRLEYIETPSPIAGPLKSRGYGVAQE